MSSPQPGGTDHVRIGLADVYREQQALKDRMGDSMGALNLTLVEIRNHLEKVDARGAASDEIHRDHATRLRSLEDSHVSQTAFDAAIETYKAQARAAMRTAIGAGIAALGTLAAFLGIVHK